MKNQQIKIGFHLRTCLTFLVIIALRFFWNFLISNKPILRIILSHRQYTGAATPFCIVLPYPFEGGDVFIFWLDATSLLRKIISLTPFILYAEWPATLPVKGVSPYSCYRSRLFGSG
jgi:hypothetical protein